jgi:SAM-dependent methyltransferase
MMPDRLRGFLRPAYRQWERMTKEKGDAEMEYWRTRVFDGRLEDPDYGSFMLAMAGEDDAEFLRDKVVVDFGCGPCGSITWATPAARRVGVDILLPRYLEEFGDDLAAQDMEYVGSTERSIPLANASADVVYTANALDHVDDLGAMSAELLRVLKPGGLFVGSFNLHEPASATEPQVLDEAQIQRHLLDHLEVESYRLAGRGPNEDRYLGFMGGDVPYVPGYDGILWVRATKPS